MKFCDVGRVGFALGWVTFLKQLGLKTLKKILLSSWEFGKSLLILPIHLPED